MSNEVIPVSEFTEKLLESRKDDFRIDMIRELMFGDDIGGIFPERTIKMADNTDILLRKASLLDTYSYHKTSPDAIKHDIETNIQRLSALINNGQGVSNSLPPIKDVWMFVYVVDEKDEIRVNTYKNPNSQDIGDVLRTEMPIVMVGFIVTYPTVFPGQPLPEGFPPEVYDWTFVSPIMADHYAEGQKVSAEFEADKLKKMFFLDFSEGVKAVKDGLDTSEALKNI